MRTKIKRISSIFMIVLLAGIFFPILFATPKDSSNESGVLAESSNSAHSDWWSMFHHDLSHTGASTSIGPNTNQTLWNYTTGGGVSSSPAVVGGLVFVGSGDSKVYALDATTGAHVWNYTTGSVVSSSPAVAGGVVYVGSWDGKVYALNATTGTQVWNCTAGDAVEWSSPAVAGGVVYVGSHDGNIYALNATTGTKVWNYTTGGPVEWSSPAVAGGIVYVGSSDSKVYALNATTGAFIWSYTTDGYIWWGWSSPAVVGGVVYVGSGDGKVYAFGVSDGWWPMFHHDLTHTGYSASTAPSSVLTWYYTTGSAVLSSPAVVDGLVFVGSRDNKIYALNATTDRKSVV